jgi:hypothetical protein
MILALGISKQDLLPSEKEEQAIDNRPGRIYQYQYFG